MACASVGKIVAIYGGYHHVLQTQIGNCLGDVYRLKNVQQPMRVSALNHAKPAAPRASVAHEHEGGCPATPAFRHIGAVRFLANCVKVVVSKDTFNFLIILTSW